MVLSNSSTYHLNDFFHKLILQTFEITSFMVYFLHPVTWIFRYRIVGFKGMVVFNYMVVFKCMVVFYCVVLFNCLILFCIFTLNANLEPSTINYILKQTRWTNIQRDRRTCKLCESIESGDEFHVLCCGRGRF